MKKLLSTLFLAAAVPATMLAKPMSMEPLKPSQLKVTPEINNSFIKADAKINPAILAEPNKRMVQTDTIPSYGWYGWYSASNYMNEHGVIHYDEHTNAVYVLHNYFTLKFEEDEETRGILRALVYEDGGRTEGEKIEIANLENNFLWGATFGVSNPTKETNPSKVNFVGFSSLSRSLNAEATQFVNGDPAFCFYDPLKIVNDEATKKVVFESGPAGSKAYSWDNLAPFPFTSTENTTMYIAGSALQANSASALHGRYGVVTLDNSSLHDIEYSDFPTAFDVSKFKDPTADGHYNSPMFFGKDKDNNLYAFINNNYKTDLNKRLPAFSVSNDNGLSWGALNIMPWNVFEAYVAPHSEGVPVEDLSFGFDAYNGTDFLMQENGDFSYVAKLFAQHKETNDLYVFDIVEVYYEGGQWGIRKVEEMRTPKAEGGYSWDRLWTIYQGQVDPIDGKLAFIETPRGNELELAITKDRKYLVMKWIDTKFSRNAKGEKIYVEETETEAVSVQYYNNTTKEWAETELQGYAPNDIYIKYREIGTDQWSDPVQLTNDERYYLHTHMPDMLPSLESIPIITSLTREEFPSTLTSKIATLPKALREMAYNDLKFTHYGVYNATTASVKDSKETKDAISVYPNPASNSLTVSCEPNSTVEIFNTLGEKMMDVKGNTANVSSLANGIYLVKVTNGGKVTSTLFTVAK